MRGGSEVEEEEFTFCGGLLEEFFLRFWTSIALSLSVVEGLTSLELAELSRFITGDREEGKGAGMEREPITEATAPFVEGTDAA